VIRACAELPVDLEIVEGVTHTEARRRYAAADIVIDQLKVGWYGVFAIEAMAMGKPVVCFLHDDALSETEKEFQTTVPIVSATPETLEQKLHPLVDSIELRQSIGASSRKYAEQLHDVDRIADQLIAIYERIA
jgi:glycosyltransferase involved in cell wall biosynthesis